MTEERIEGINEKIKKINREEAEHILKLQKLIQPIARAVNRIMSRKGVNKGRFMHRRREYKHDKFLIIQERGVLGTFGDVSVRYDNRTVMEFNEWFGSVFNFKDRTSKYLFYFREGPWMEELTILYNEVMLDVLKHNFNIVKEDLTHDING